MLTTTTTTARRNDNDNEVASSSPTSSVPPHTTTTTNRPRLVPPQTTTTRPRPRHVVTHLVPPHATTTAAPRPRLFLTHLVRPPTHDDGDSASPLAHPPCRRHRLSRPSTHNNNNVSPSRRRHPPLVPPATSPRHRHRHLRLRVAVAIAPRPPRPRRLPRLAPRPRTRVHPRPGMQERRHNARRIRRALASSSLYSVTAHIAVAPPCSSSSVGMVEQQHDACNRVCHTVVPLVLTRALTHPRPHSPRDDSPGLSRAGPWTSLPGPCRPHCGTGARAHAALFLFLFQFDRYVYSILRARALDHSPACHIARYEHY